MDQLKKICNVKVWLIILAVIHTVVGVLLQTDPDVDAQLEISGVFLAISAYLLRSFRHLGPGAGEVGRRVVRTNLGLVRGLWGARTGGRWQQQLVAVGGIDSSWLFGE